jgi:hypothetical protein
MNNNPSLILEFAPETFEILSIKFKANADEEYERLHQLLAVGIRSATKQATND